MSIVSPLHCLIDQIDTVHVLLLFSIHLLLLRNTLSKVSSHIYEYKTKHVRYIDICINIFTRCDGLRAIQFLLISKFQYNKL
jgi:hypothetical protein